MVAATMDRENPDSSISLPNSAPSMNTGKYSLRKPTILSMNRPVKIGANRITLWPRYAASIRKHSAASTIRKAILAVPRLRLVGLDRDPSIDGHAQGGHCTKVQVSSPRQLPTLARISLHRGCGLHCEGKP